MNVNNGGVIIDSLDFESNLERIREYPMELLLNNDIYLVCPCRIVMVIEEALHALLLLILAEGALRNIQIHCRVFEFHQLAPKEGVGVL